MSLHIGKPGRFEFKARESGEMTVEGYLSTYGNVDEGGDVVMKGAFERTLASSRKVKFLYAHNPESVLGPPLALHSDDVGLFAKGTISQTSLGRDVHTLLLDGAVDSWSMGYLPRPDGFRFKESADGGLVRLLTDVDLFEGSLLALPMNEEAVVTAVKALDAEDLTALLEGKPFPNEHACRLRNPGDFQAESFRRTSRNHNGKQYSVIMGKLKGESTMTQQAFRYPKDTWTAAEARSHCSSHDGIGFEAASDGKGADDCGCTKGVGLAYELHATKVIETATEFLARTRQGAAQRTAEGRALSDDRRAEMASASGSLREVVKALAAEADQLDALLQPPPPQEFVRATDLRARRLKLRGVTLTLEE